MKYLPVNLLNLTLTVIFFIGSLSLGFSQGTACSNPDPLTPGTQQCGTNSNVGSFNDASAAPTNPCTSAYNDGEYWYSYTGTGQALQLDVSALSATYSGLFVFDACPASAPTCVASYTSGFSTANFTVTTPALTLGQTYYIAIINWSAPYQTNFCLDAVEVAPPVPPANDECAGAYALTVNPDNLCGSVTAGTINLATASVQNTASCGGTEDDDVWFSFTATGPVHTIDLLNVVGSTTDLYHSVWSGACPALTLVAGSCSDPNSSTVTGLTAGVTYYIRVYSWTSTPGQTTSFNVCLGTPPPPPANDDCAGAIPLTVNPDNLCGTTTTSSIASATASTQSAASCGGTEDDDVWFSFTATGTVHTIDLLNIVGGTTDLYHSVWSGSCPALTLVAGSCSDPNSSTVTGLTPGVTYFIRVYSWTSTTGQTSVFDVCLGTPPPPPANDDCAGAIALTVNPDQLCGTVTTSSIASATPSTQNTASCGGTEDDDVWFSFTATSSQHYIDLLNIVGGTTDLYHSVWEGVCPALTLVAGSCSDPNSSTVTGLTPGNTYYVRVYSWTSTSGQTSVFDICIGSDPTPTCVDGIQNQGELGIDCGGPCAACPPPSCVDGILNQGELGIDCGGPCPICPPTLIPVACSNVTYNLTTQSSVSFYDDGGPGGDPCLDAAVATGNYCNCNCFTTVTICAAPGEYVVADFNEFAMWNTTSGWDWMKIYDNSTASGTKLYDNSSTGPDNPFGDCGIGATPMNFCSSGQCLTFEFWATSVVNRAGWDALVTSVVTPCVIPLSIELASFSGKNNRDINELNWVTSSEINNDYFIVEATTDAVGTFENIGIVDGAGNSNNEKRYDFIDNNPFGNVVYYRLKQVDFDGKFSYSNIVAVNMMDGLDINLYPSPSKNNLFFDINKSKDATYTIAYSNLLGNAMTETVNISTGKNTYQLSEFSKLASGIYFIQILDEGNEVILNQKVIKE